MQTMMRTIAVAALLAALGTTAPARAEGSAAGGGGGAGGGGVQTKGSEVFNKLQIGFHPIGFQAGFTNYSPSGYKLTGDVAGLIAPTSFGGLWLGGGLNYTYGFYSCFNNTGNCGHDLQLWAFVMLTFEKLIHIPLVPFARAGVGGDVLLYNATAGAFVLRVGGGIHYYLLKWLGLGVETNFTFGPGFYPNGVGTAFYGNWDVGLGARFAF